MVTKSPCWNCGTPSSLNFKWLLNGMILQVGGGVDNGMFRNLFPKDATYSLFVCQLLPFVTLCQGGHLTSPLKRSLHKPLKRVTNGRTRCFNPICQTKRITNGIVSERIRDLKDHFNHKDLNPPSNLVVLFLLIKETCLVANGESLPQPKDQS